MMIEVTSPSQEQVLEPQSPIYIIQGVLDGLESEGAQPVMTQVEEEEEMMTTMVADKVQPDQGLGI